MDNYSQTIEKIYSLMPDYQNVGSSAYKPGLDRIKKFNDTLGRPDRDFAMIHVAGTNGKGSVSHMLASVLMSAGYKVGLYTSPHLIDFRERIRVDGEVVPEKYVMNLVRKHYGTALEQGLSFFELTFGMALKYFSDSGVEIAVIETGLGGRLDATNIIKPILSIITNIGTDHQQFLGTEPEQIAGEKAGIIKKGVPVVIGEKNETTSTVLAAQAAREGSDIFFAADMFPFLNTREDRGKQVVLLDNRYSGEPAEFVTDLNGIYQGENMSTVMSAITILNRLTPVNISRRAITQGIGSVSVSTGLRGRWEKLHDTPLVICDTGHNPEGLEKVMQQIRSQTYENLYMILGFSDDKDIDQIIANLPRDAEYIFTSSSVRRAYPHTFLLEKALGAGLKADIAPDVYTAYTTVLAAAGEGDMIFIGGSSFVVADLLAKL